MARSSSLATCSWTWRTRCSIRACAITDEQPRPMNTHSFWYEAWRRLRANRAAIASAWVLAVIVAAALLVPLISPYNYYNLDWDRLNLPPTVTHGWHLLGTDALGRDLLVRTMWGCRISLL